MKHIKIFENYLNQDNNDFVEFSLGVAFTVPDKFNLPGYWTTFEGESLLTYKGPRVSEEEILELFRRGNLEKTFIVDYNILEELRMFGLDDLSDIATKSKTIEEFEMKASEALYEYFSDYILEFLGGEEEGAEFEPGYFDDKYWFKFYF